MKKDGAGAERAILRIIIITDLYKLQKAKNNIFCLYISPVDASKTLFSRRFLFEPFEKRKMKDAEIKLCFRIFSLWTPAGKGVKALS